MTKICDFSYPIYDLIKNFDTLFLTLVYSCRKHKFVKSAYQALNGVEEGKARMGEGGRDEEVAPSKRIPN